MGVILTQAALMESGSTALKAIKSGEIACILAGFVAMAYISLEILAAMGANTIERGNETHQAYQIIAIMRLISDKIHRCSSGQIDAYAGPYYLCADLAKNFLNADFDKALRAYCDWHKTHVFDPDESKLAASRNYPDLSDCF